MHDGQQLEEPQTPEDPAQFGKEAHLLILGSSGAGRTSVEAVRPEDGLVVWAYDRQQALVDVVCSINRVYVSTSIDFQLDPKQPARLAALQARDGTVLWRADPARFRHQMVCARFKYGLRAYVEWFSLGAVKQVIQGLRFAGGLSLLSAGNMLLACKPYGLFTFDTTDFTLRWVVPVRSHRASTMLAADTKRIYVQSEGAAIQALDARTGRALWSTSRHQYVEQVVAGAGLVYAWDTHTKWAAITTLRAADGTELRRLSLPQGQDKPQQFVTVTTDGMAYFLRNHRLVATRLEGEQELWRSERLEALPQTGSAFTSRVELAYARDFLSYAYQQFEDRASTLHVGAVDRESGQTLWRWQSAKRPTQAHGLSVVARSDMIYVSAHDGISAFQGSSGRLLWQMPHGFDRVRMVAVSVRAETGHNRPSARR